MRSLVLALLWLTLVVYIVLGGLVFHFIEESSESSTKTNAFDGYKNFLCTCFITSLYVDTRDTDDYDDEEGKKCFI